MINKKCFVKQSDSTDCGASCLQSIIIYYHGFINKEQIRLDTCTTTKGTTAYHLIKAANKYGFDAYGVKYENKIIPPDIVLPAIFHVVLPNNYHHFIVVYKINKNKVLIMDPLDKMKTIKMSELNEIWDGIAIIMYPATEIKYEKIESIKKTFFDLLKEEFHIVIKIIITSIIITLLSIWGSFYFKTIINNMSINTKGFIYFIIMLFGIMLIVKLILSYIRDNLIVILSKNIDIKLIIPFIKHIFFLPMIKLSTRETGEIVTRLNDLERIKNLFTKIFITIFVDLTLALIASFVLLSMYKDFFLIVIIIYILYLLVALLYNYYIKKEIKKTIDSETSYNSILTELLSNFKTVKNLHCYDYFLKKIDNQFVQNIKNHCQLNFWLLKEDFSKNMLSQLGIFILNSYGIICIMNQKITFVDLITFTSILTYLENPLKSMIELIPEYQYIKSVFLKISEFNAIDEEKLSLNKVNFINGDITFSNISYSYNKYDFILDKITLKIPQNSFTFIQAKSGSGKSTLCKLLSGHLTPDKGNILINDINIKDYPLDTLRSNITYLSQEETIFNDTIKNNILLGKKISLKKLAKVKDICGLEKIFINKPLRYETLISKENHNLSGGEMQRILLARSLVLNRPILILDEALNELEESEEKRIIKSLKANYKKTTIIYITHRQITDHQSSVIRLKEKTC